MKGENVWNQAGKLRTHHPKILLLRWREPEPFPCGLSTARENGQARWAGQFRASTDFTITLMGCCRNLTFVSISLWQKWFCYTSFHLKSQNLLMTLKEDLLRVTWAPGFFPIQGEIEPWRKGGGIRGSLEPTPGPRLVKYRGSIPAREGERPGESAMRPLLFQPWAVLAHRCSGSPTRVDISY